MQLYDAGPDGRVLVWLVDEPLELPAPPGLEWMTPEQLDGYYLLYQPETDIPSTDLQTRRPRAGGTPRQSRRYRYGFGKGVTI